MFLFPKGWKGCCEIGEIIQNARGGCVVKYLALMEHLPEMGKKLGENNRQAFEKLYDRPFSLQKFESLLKSLDSRDG
ncbi:MAG: hypothetical protein HY036_06295 [Nitrospirae bacterium]|nr:hypothetical protein [Nitrospirota bacterium]